MELQDAVVVVWAMLATQPLFQLLVPVVNLASTRGLYVHVAALAEVPIVGYAFDNASYWK
jgi:hypothetical protein